MFARLPEALVTLTETQQFRLELDGSTIFHQVPSEFFPTIWEVCPIFKALRTNQAVPGPRRQLTATSFTEAVGTVGVEVVVGSGVLVGRGVCVGVSVGNGCVGEGVTAVGVSVAGMFAGRLQASMAKTRARVENKLRDFIVSPFLPNPSYLPMIPPAIDHLVSDSQESLVIKWSLRCHLDIGVIMFYFCIFNLCRFSVVTWFHTGC